MRLSKTCWGAKRLAAAKIVSESLENVRWRLRSRQPRTHAAVPRYTNVGVLIEMTASPPIPGSRRWLVPLCCLCLMVSFSGPSFGFCFQPHPSLGCEFLDSDAVFTGKVLSVRSEDASGYISGWHYRLEVLRVFRGPHKKVIEVYTGNDSARYPLDLNRRYLIFADKYRDRLVITECDDNTPLSEAKKLIRKIEMMKIPRGGIIEGRVVSHYVGPRNRGVAGVKVLVSGKGKTYRLTTDRRGWFRVLVSPGVYSVTAVSTPAHRMEAFDLNYGGNPNMFRVRAGRCAGFEFVADSYYNY